MSEFGKRESSIRWVVGLDSWKCAYKMMHIKFTGQVPLYCLRNHFPYSQLQVSYPLNHNWVCDEHLLCVRNATVHQGYLECKTVCGIISPLTISQSRLETWLITTNYIAMRQLLLIQVLQKVKERNPLFFRDQNKEEVILESWRLGWCLPG